MPKNYFRQRRLHWVWDTQKSIGPIIPPPFHISSYCAAVTCGSTPPNITELTVKKRLKRPQKSGSRNLTQKQKETKLQISVLPVPHQITKAEWAFLATHHRAIGPSESVCFSSERPWYEFKQSGNTLSNLSR